MQHQPGEPTVEDQRQDQQEQQQLVLQFESAYATCQVPELVREAVDALAKGLARGCDLIGESFVEVAAGGACWAPLSWLMYLA